VIVLGSALRDFDSVGHAFFTRSGGVSTGVYSSLNCSHGSHDDRDAIVENRRRAMVRLGLPAHALVTCRQVHGVKIINVNGKMESVRNIEADGLVTNQRGIALGVLTADCAPIILADVDAGVVGSVHAGWRGALAGVIEAGIKSMVGLGADIASIKASIGPCIGPSSYEVGSEFARRFVKESCRVEIFFKPAHMKFFRDSRAGNEKFVTTTGLHWAKIGQCEISNYFAILIKHWSKCHAFRFWNATGKQAVKPFRCSFSRNGIFGETGNFH